MPSVLCLPHPFPPSSHIVCLSVPPAEAKGTKFQAGPAVVPRCGCFLHKLTVPWGLPCTVSADTCLFPPDLNPDLDNTQLAATAGIKSCFLRTKAGFSVHAAARFSKELQAAMVHTVGDFVAHTFPDARLNVHATEKLARCLNLDAVNLHAASGTPGGCDMMLHESPALRDLRVAFMCLSRCLWRVEPFLRVTVPVRVCVIPLHASRSTPRQRWRCVGRLPSLADDRPPHVCGLSPPRVVNDPLAMCLLACPRVASADPLWPRWHPLAAYSIRAGECPHCCGIDVLATLLL